MVDDYAGYKALFSENANGAYCLELACFAHVLNVNYHGRIPSIMMAG